MITAPPAPAKDNDTFAQEMAEAVRSSLIGLPSVGGNHIEELVGESIRAVTQEFKDEFISGLAQNSLAQPHNSNNGETIIMPDGMRFFYTTKKSAIAVLEQKPQLRTLKFSTKTGADERINESTTKTHYRLALPYTLFVAHWMFSSENNSMAFKELFFFYRNQPLKSLSDAVYLPNLPNISLNSPIPPLVCLGGDLDLPVGTFLEHLSALVGHYWNTTFNDDLSTLFWTTAEKERKLRSLVAWEQESEKDPLFPIKVQWDKWGTVYDVAKYVLKDLAVGGLPVRETNQHAVRVYNRAWERARTGNKSIEVAQKIKSTGQEQVRDFLATFAEEMAVQLGAIPNEHVRRTVQTAMKSALKKASALKPR